MKDIRIKDIIDLAAIDISDPNAELKKVYDWHHERKMMIIKGTVGIAISLLITLMISYYKNELKVDSWSMIWPFLSILLSMTYGFYELYRIKSIGKKYIASITLLNKFKQITPFLELYRKTITND